MKSHKSHLDMIWLIELSVRWEVIAIDTNPVVYQMQS